MREERNLSSFYGYYFIRSPAWDTGVGTREEDGPELKVKDLESLKSLKISGEAG